MQILWQMLWKRCCTHSKVCNNCCHFFCTKLQGNLTFPQNHAMFFLNDMPLRSQQKETQLYSFFSLPPWTSFVPWHPLVAVMHRQGRFTEWLEHDRWPSQLERSGCRWQEGRGVELWSFQQQIEAYWIIESPGRLLTFSCELVERAMARERGIESSKCKRKLVYAPEMVSTNVQNAVIMLDSFHMATRLKRNQEPFGWHQLLRFFQWTTWMCSRCPSDVRTLGPPLACSHG